MTDKTPEEVRDAAIKSAWQMLNDASIEARRAYDAAVEPARQVCKKAVDSAWQAYHAAGQGARR